MNDLVTTHDYAKAIELFLRLLRIGKNEYYIYPRDNQWVVGRKNKCLFI